MVAAGTAGLIAASAAVPPRGRPEAADGTPEQVHLTWGDDPARTVVVSWASVGQSVRPRVRIGQRVIPAAERAVAGPPSGSVTWTYHARVDGLRPGATYGYAVTADNDANITDPFSATFTTAPEGRAKFRFTSFGDLAPFGDLAAPGPVLTGPSGWSGQAAAAYAVGAVETFQPLFHLLNGDFADAGAAPGQQPQAWRDFGNQVQTSAANRPWLPVPGSHEPAADGQPDLPFLTRYTLPSNGVDGFEGRWYAFRVGTALFVTLSGDDVACAGRPEAGGYSGGAQTRWLEATLAAARGDASIDWIVVQLHQCACSSGAAGSGSDLGVRREWLPLFDTYEVDLVLAGHDHGYERSFPVRGFEADAGPDEVTGAETGAGAGTGRPHPVTTVDSGVFDTSQGTVHLVLGCGGAPAEAGPGQSPRLARVFTRPAAQAPAVPADAVPATTVPADAVPDARVPSDEVPRGGVRPAADTVEAAIWSARRNAAPGYGIAVFDVNPGSEASGQTSVIVRYYHAAVADPAGPAAGGPGRPADDFVLFESFTLVRPRSDGRRWHPK
jgi:Purple acid Phosphatase, N-terminal domain/Calcineurin-like phosphoesterase